MNTPPAHTHKRGDSLDLMAAIPLQFADGHFVGWTPSAQVRTAADVLVADLAVQWSDPATTRALRLHCLDTSAWPLGKCDFDIQFVRAADGYTLSTNTVTLYVVRDITRV